MLTQNNIGMHTHSSVTHLNTDDRVLQSLKRTDFMSAADLGNNAVYYGNMAKSSFINSARNQLNDTNYSGNQENNLGHFNNRQDQIRNELAYDMASQVVDKIGNAMSKVGGLLGQLTSGLVNMGINFATKFIGGI